MKYFLLILFSINISFLFAQKSIDSASMGKLIIIVQAERYSYIKQDTAGNLIALVGHAIVKQAKTTIEADSIVLNQKENTAEAFGNVHINDADSIQTYAQYAKYAGKEKKAYLNNKVKLSDGKGILTTEKLEYDTQFKIGTYTNGGKVVNGKTVLTSKEGMYYGETKDVYFKRNVVLIDPEYKITTDTLLYNTNTNITTFVAPSTIYNSKRMIKTSDGFYDLKNKKANFGKRPFIDDSTYTFTANDMQFDDKTGLGEFKGNAVYKSKDTAGRYDIIAGNIKTNNKNNSFLATQKPILFLKQEKDTILISADTLFSTQLSSLLKTKQVVNIRDTISSDYTFITDTVTIKKDSSTNRYFEAYYNVKIFSDSLQAVGDSLFYNLQDSTFRLYKNPVAWTQQNQITGDTIYLYIQNKKPERIKVFENAMAISKEAEGYYNQVRGNSINGYFKDGKINFLKTKGSPAENVYYATDDYKKLVGVNKFSSDVIHVFFDEGKPQRVVFINNLQGTLYPMRQVNHDEIKVKKFVWLEAIRPKSKYDILAN
jgi:lipopolysaccharide export system protein LptA